MNYDVIIGLEIHTEVKTASKMFCSCANRFDDPANTNTCPICLGHPGTLPLPNKSAIEKCLLLGLALDCQINQNSKFDRKNYFYPDLPKGYQISQYDLPFCHHGKLAIGQDRHIDITRIHLEEDTGKLSHSSSYSAIDFNRAGAPLIELVTEPVLVNAAEAKHFCQHFQQTLRYLQISDADMEKGQMRCEANVSLQIPGSWLYEDGQIKATSDQQLNAKVEVKNINSFKALEKAINFEIDRQSKALDQKQHISPETRGWNDQTNTTVSQRVKETQADYRYFPEPDIPALIIDETWLTEIKNQVVELPQAKINRLSTEYGLSQNDAELLASDPKLSDFAEEVISELYEWINSSGDNSDRQKHALVKLAAAWLGTELFKHFKINSESIADIRFTAENLAELISLLYQDKINSSAAQIIFNQMYQVGGDPSQIMIDLNLEQLDNDEALSEIIRSVLAEHPEQSSAFKAGKTTLMNFLVGKVMAASGGKANPKSLPDLITKIINS